jgi:hypothetical protein
MLQGMQAKVGKLLRLRVLVNRHHPALIAKFIGSQHLALSLTPPGFLGELCGRSLRSLRLRAFKAFNRRVRRGHAKIAEKTKTLRFSIKNLKLFFATSARSLRLKAVKALSRKGRKDRKENQKQDFQSTIKNRKSTIS